MCSDEGRVVDWLMGDVRVDATAGLLPRSAAAGEGLRGRAHLAQTTKVPAQSKGRLAALVTDEGIYLAIPRYSSCAL